MKKKVSQKKEMIKNLIWIIAILVVIALIATLCIGYFKKATYEVKNPIATLEIKDFGTIKFELYPDKPQNTQTKYITLANNGF